MATTTANPNPFCANCKVKPRFFDGVRYHDFCGKTCATLAVQMTAPNSVCPVCKTNPVFSDGVNTFEYCGRSCASKVTPQYFGKNKLTGQHPCLVCKLPKANGPYCSGTCSDTASKGAPKLIEIPNNHPIFKNVAHQFQISWKSGTAPQVKHVYKVVISKELLGKYEAYRDSVEARGKFTKRGRAPGNENRRWHGTRRNCTLGDNGKTSFCGSSACALCNIISMSFDMGRARGGSFGTGIYTSSHSSKSNGYLSNGTSSKLKAMLLNKVVVGEVSKVTFGRGITTTPPGADSVLYDNASSDELIVYRNDAIRPSYLVMYTA